MERGGRTAQGSENQRCLEIFDSQRPFCGFSGISSQIQKGMPLGNLTSQFFANVYLNELDQFVKHKLKAKFYIRYVDDFVILHNNKQTLEDCKEKINNFLKTLKLELHPDKSKIIPLSKGVSLLGYRVFYYHKLLRKSNLRKFRRKITEKINLVKNDSLPYNSLLGSLNGWVGYAMWADTCKLRKAMAKEINKLDSNAKTILSL